MKAVIAFVVAHHVILTVIYVFYVVALWRVFTKAHVAGWKSVVPFYNLYLLFKISWDKKMFWALFGSLLLAALMRSFSGMFVPEMLASLLTIVADIVYILMNVNLSRSFGNQGWFTLGLIFLNPAFIVILGFSTRQKYLGPQIETQNHFQTAQKR
ncbi:MAG: DUF5684 domain-containing protein [Oscillospiraceae bacterium]|jgi:hypothetical protein|nr:DUF5684 domain-containing protein [Oscillospiraceae bacterium]MDD3261962.1 DUF5684 domain-containing protein [Oscillospiraceae bacterium]